MPVPAVYVVSVALITLFEMLTFVPAVKVSCLAERSDWVATTEVSTDTTSFVMSMPLPAVYVVSAALIVISVVPSVIVMLLPAVRSLTAGLCKINAGSLLLVSAQSDCSCAGMFAVSSPEALVVTVVPSTLADTTLLVMSMPLPALIGACAAAQPGAPLESTVRTLVASAEDEDGSGFSTLIALFWSMSIPVPAV